MAKTQILHLLLSELFRNHAGNCQNCTSNYNLLVPKLGKGKSYFHIVDIFGDSCFMNL